MLENSLTGQVTLYAKLLFIWALLRLLLNTKIC